MSEKKSHTLNLPKELYEQIQKLADTNYRSFNKQIVFMLQEVLKKREKISKPDKAAPPTS